MQSGFISKQQSVVQKQDIIYFIYFKTIIIKCIINIKIIPFFSLGIASENKLTILYYLIKLINIKEANHKMLTQHNCMNF